MTILDEKTLVIEDAASGLHIKAAGLRGPGGRSDRAARGHGQFASPDNAARSLLSSGGTPS